MLSALHSITALLLGPVGAPSDADAPFDAVEDVAATTTQAAGDFARWIGSGERDALFAAGVLIVTFVGLMALRRVLKALLPKLPRRDAYSWSALLTRVIGRVRVYFLFAVALAAANEVAGLPESVGQATSIVLVLAAVVQLAEIIQEISISWIKRRVARNSGDATALASAINIIKWLANVAIWSTALLLILDSIGADVTALVAGLGIGGVAIGLASQGAFKDLFSALSIVMDRPFQRGDTVRYGDTWGEIEDIGLKTTRIRSKSGEQIAISNTNLLDLEIHNMGRMTKRRIEADFGVVYQTKPDVAERIVALVSKIVKDMDGVEYEYCSFAGFGSSSLEFELVFYSLNPDYKRSKAVRGKVLLAVFRAFKENGIEFAYPTQTLHIASLPQADAAATNDATAGVEEVLETEGERATVHIQKGDEDDEKSRLKH